MLVKLPFFILNVFAFFQNGKESSVSVVMNIKDENDNAPKFAQTLYLGHISESSSINSVVLMKNSKPLVITATDADSEQNSILVYDILNEEARAYFSIDSTTGAIRSVAPLDHEVMPSLNFSVSVRDRGTPSLMALTNALVSISITDVNDVPPRFLRQEYSTFLLLPTHK